MMHHRVEGVMVSDEVLLERRERTLIITINRPEARNAFNLAVAQGLADAMDELDDTAELSVAVITGAGGNFCAGMDLKAFMAGEVPAIEGRGIGFTEHPPQGGEGGAGGEVGEHQGVRVACASTRRSGRGAATRRPAGGE